MVQISAKIRSRILQLKELQNNPPTQARFQLYWNLLKQDEQFLVQLINGTPARTGNIVIANMLYVLNNEIEAEVRDILKLFGLPESAIGVTTMQAFTPTITSEPGYVDLDGILCQNSPYAGLDPNWIELFLAYIWYQEFPGEFAPFGNNPSIISIDSDHPLSIAIFGDWGTGEYNDFGFSSPSSLVGKGISGLQPDMTVHLGDVYYAGSEEQTRTQLLSHFPSGKMVSFTMNGNHEMFDGANAYFKTALTHPIFSNQQQTSYFAILYGNWVIIGLDTAYHDQTIFHLEGILTDEDQLRFIKDLEIKEHQKIILLTHHTAMTIDGYKTNDPLFEQIYLALGNRYPDYWYYGHLHNGVVYNNDSAQGKFTCLSGLHPQIRCFGHASIPIGKAPILHDENGNTIKGIDYYASTAMPNPGDHPGLKNRVLNGFMMLRLTGNEIEEQVYEVSAQNEVIPVWNNKK